MNLTPEELGPAGTYRLMISLIVPRPIAWVTTKSLRGVVNLAPFSYFNGVCSNPPLISIVFGSKKGQKKDTLRNIEETKEFVVNLVSEKLEEKMVTTSGNYPPEISELKLIDLTEAPSEKVKTPSIAESPVHLECTLYDIHHFGEDTHKTSMVIGKIEVFSFAPNLLQNNQINPDALRAIGRMGGDFYCRTRDRLSLKRPRI